MWKDIGDIKVTDQLILKKRDYLDRILSYKSLKKEEEGKRGNQRNAANDEGRANEAEGEVRESESIGRIQFTIAGLEEGGRGHELRNMDSL